MWHCCSVPHEFVLKPLTATGGHERLRIRFRGAVQGVGFRPFLYKLAHRQGVSGFVLNDADGVLAEIEGVSLKGFLAAMQREHPPLARIDGMDVTPMPSQREDGFVIRESTGSGAGCAAIGPDAATCDFCLSDMFDPGNQLYHYPFIACTDCGPRFTISTRLPYDRANTTMAGFIRCAVCALDYDDPMSRRFHAENTACATCGPRLSHPVEQIASSLRAGDIVALKGVGGYQLVCDAMNTKAVLVLRGRKRRPEKPFAVMVENACAATRIAIIDQAETALLEHTARPVVMLKTRNRVVPEVAPGLGNIGIMLPGTPVHHLLFQALAGDPALPAVLVVTSANLQGEPLVTDDDDARRNLAGIADLIVTHDRPINARADDSVMSVTDGGTFFIRRARGFVPDPIDLGEDGPPVLAVGGHLKTTLCVTRGREAFVSQHIGDLNTPATIRFYEETAAGLLRVLNVSPSLVACDLHPDYRSTRYAESLGIEMLRVQHHAAHLAAVAAEHSLSGPLLGAALDGQGYGQDGGAWGGELLLLNGAGWRRCGHLRPLALPGGDLAAREPWRMGVAALVALGRGEEAPARFVQHQAAGKLAALLGAGAFRSTTTSMGRLFDAAAALLGVCAVQSYEGQAAMQLEALVGSPISLAGGYVIRDHVLDFRPLLNRLLAPGMTARDGAAVVHGTIIAGVAEWIGEQAAALGQTEVLLGGGCLSNHLLTEGLTNALRGRGLTPFLPRLVPANDGGLSLGQAAIARAYLKAGAPAGQH